MSFRIRELLNDKRVVLASASPRRKELMRLLTEDFEIIPALGEEHIPEENEDVFKISEILAEQKCREVAERCNPDENTIVIGCDTVVIDPDLTPLGKPVDDSDALDMLKHLQGVWSYVVSGVCVYYRGNYRVFSEETKVNFYPAADEELIAYIATKEPRDKAGAYAVQGLGGLLIKGIAGDYNNVVGMPVSRLARELTEILGG